MRQTICATLLGAALMTSAYPAGAVNPPIAIAAHGEGAWYIRCDIEASASDIVLIELSSSRQSYADAHLRRANCRYQAGRSPLSVTITGAGWTCPFRGAPEGGCEIVIPRMGSGEFRLVQASGGQH